MPIHYEIDPELGIVHRVFEGEVTAQELEEHWRAFLADPSVPPHLVILSDLRDCRMIMSAEEVGSIVRTVVEPLLEGRRWVSAIVAGSDPQYELSKQYSVYSTECGVTEVFRTEDDAAAWLVEAIQRPSPVD